MSVYFLFTLTLQEDFCSVSRISMISLHFIFYRSWKCESANSFILCMFTFLQAELVCTVLWDFGTNNIVPQKLDHGYTLSKCKKSDNSELTQKPNKYCFVWNWWMIAIQDVQTTLHPLTQNLTLWMTALDMWSYFSDDSRIQSMFIIIYTGYDTHFQYWVSFALQVFV